MAQRLSDRQRQAALLFAQGMSAKAIARRLNCSEGTVRKHLQEAYARLGVSGRDALADALGINRVGSEWPIPEGSELLPDRPVGGADASETDGAKRTTLDFYRGLGIWRTPPRPPGGRLTVVLMIVGLNIMVLGTVFLVLASVYAVLNSAGFWQ